MAQISKQIWHRMSHITGPTAVLVAICFGEQPKAGPTVIKTLGADQTDGTVKFDLYGYIAELLAGVARANSELGTTLQVQAIQVVPDDYPGKGQVEHVAYTLTKHVVQAG